MAIGVAVAWVLEQPGEGCALREIELREIFAEERLRRFTDSVDLIAAAVAEVHLVGVHLEDLLLVEAGFELERDEDLDHLPLEALLRREKEILRQLLRERRAAAGFVVREEVCDSAFGDT